MSVVDWKRALLLEARAERRGIDEVAVVGNRKPSSLVLNLQGLNVDFGGLARRRIPHMADGPVS